MYAIRSYYALADGRHPREMSGPGRAFDPLGARAGMAFDDLLGAFDLGEKLLQCAGEDHVAAGLFEHARVLLGVARIAREIFRVVELKRVDENADAAHIVFRPRSPQEFHMPGV